MSKKINGEDFLNKKYSHLRVSSFYRNEKHQNRLWFSCICDCGKEVQLWSRAVYTGNNKSCGCSALDLRKASVLRKYGVDNVSKNTEIHQKKKNTIKANFGVECGFDLKDRIKASCLARYGVDHPMKTLEVQDRVARSSNNKFHEIHWFSGAELLCTGGYERDVVRFLNKKNIKFLWQPQVFILSNGSSYRPDLFLVDSGKWIEIKGYWRDDAFEKYTEFSQIPGIVSGIWDKQFVEAIRKEIV